MSRNLQSIVCIMGAMLCATCHYREYTSSPIIYGISPDRTTQNVSKTVKIYGRHFHMPLHSHPLSSNHKFHSDFKVVLGGQQLSHVVLLDSQTLLAVVPRELPPGTHELTVETPSGSTARLDAAFHVAPAPSSVPVQPWIPHANGEGSIPHTLPAPESPVAPALHAPIGDPLGDGVSAAFVSVHAGTLWLGPGKNKAEAMKGQGDNASFLNFEFHADFQGNTSRNPNAQEGSSIGKPGCTPHTAECGPDNEDSVSAFAGITFQGTEWMLLSGGRSQGDLNYVYLGQQEDDVLRFRYVDLSAALGQNVYSVASAYVFNNRLFVGFANRGGLRPTLVSLQLAPVDDGLDAVSNGNNSCHLSAHDVCDLHAHQFTTIGMESPVTAVDVITSFNNRLYVANHGGCTRSTTSVPLDARNHPEHWADCTPNHLAFHDTIPWYTNKDTNRGPRDRSIAGMVEFAGSLIMARNTEEGPQLWRCSPGLATDCGPDDWHPVITPIDANGGFGDGNTQITMLQVLGPFLYVGLDSDVHGAAIYATAQPHVSHASDFVGYGGCALGSPGCEGFGGNGLASNSTHIFSHALLQNDHQPVLFVLSGDAMSPLVLHRFGGAD